MSTEFIVKFSFFFDKVECCFDIVDVFGYNVVVLATMLNEISSFRQIEHVQFVSTLSEGRNFVGHGCRKNRLTCSIRQCCFDIVADVDGAFVLDRTLTLSLFFDFISLPW